MWILRVPPFALGIARKAVEEFVIERYGGGDAGDGKGHIQGNGDGKRGRKRKRKRQGPQSADCDRRTARRSDPKLLPTHMQLIMGIGTAEELALAEIKAEEAMKRTLVEGSDVDSVPEVRMVAAKCLYTGHVQEREWTAKDAVERTGEAFDRLSLVPLIARPLARNTVERFAREHSMWRITTVVMDENKQAMIEADEFDMDTMLVMFKELQTKQLRPRPKGSTA